MQAQEMRIGLLSNSAYKVVHKHWTRVQSIVILPDLQLSMKLALLFEYV